MSDHPYTVDGVQMEEGDAVPLHLPDEPASGVWCSPFASGSGDTAQVNGVYTVISEEPS